TKYVINAKKEKNIILCAFLIAKIRSAKNCIAMHLILPITYVKVAHKNGVNYKNNLIFYLFLMYIDQRWSVALIITTKRYLSLSAKILAHKTHFVVVEGTIN